MKLENSYDYLLILRVYIIYKKNVQTSQPDYITNVDYCILYDSGMMCITLL